MNEKTTIATFSFISLLILLGSFPLPGAEATVYEPGLEEGHFMTYEVKHSPEIDGVTFLVTSVTNETVTLNVTSTLTNGTLVNDTLSISFGEIVLANASRVIIPTNTTDGWVSVFGENEIALGDDHIRFMMTENRNRFNQVRYTFDETLDISNAPYIQFEVSTDDVSSEDTYYLSVEDEAGEVISIEFTFSKVPDPRTEEFLLWSTITVTTPLDENNSIDLSKIKSFVFLYDGSSDRILRVRNIQVLEVDDVDHIYQFYEFYPIYLVIASNLVKDDQIYPDLPFVIDEVDEIVHQDVKRTVLKGSIVFLSNGQPFVGTEYVWDAETGILIESSFTARGTREVTLTDTNAWAPQNFLAYLATFITATIPMGIATFWNQGGGIAAGVLLAWVIGFGSIIIYDKWKRNELSAFKQWMPFLYILIIASVVSFLLLRVVPLAFD